MWVGVWNVRCPAVCRSIASRRRPTWKLAVEGRRRETRSFAVRRIDLVRDQSRLIVEGPVGADLCRSANVLDGFAEKNDATRGGVGLAAFAEQSGMGELGDEALGAMTKSMWRRFRTHPTCGCSVAF